MALISEVPEEPEGGGEPEPPRPARVRVWDGERWVAYFGDTSSVDQRFKPVFFGGFAAAWRYLEHAPQGIEGIAQGQSPRVALWRRYDVGPGVATKPWDQLSERTKQGYRGRMRAALGLHTEEQFARFHATADSATIKWLRRHGPMPPELVVGPSGEALEPGRGGGGTEWVTTWEQSRGAHRRQQEEPE